jgi:hypothetical protein
MKAGSEKRGKCEGIEKTKDNEETDVKRVK